MENGIKKRFDRKGSIKNQLRIVFTILIVVPIIILGFYAYIIARNNLFSQTQQTMVGNAEVIASGLDNNVKKLNDVVKFISYEEEFRRSLEHAQVDPYSLTEQLNNNIEPLIWYYMGSDSNIDDIHIYTEEISEDYIGEFLSRPATVQEQNWYNACRSEYSAIWVIGDDGNNYIIKALLDVGTSSKVVGIVALRVNEKTFFSITSQKGSMENGILVLDESGNIVTMKSLDDATLNYRIIEQIQSGEINYKKNAAQTSEYFLARTDSITNGWQVYYYIAKSELSSDVAKILSSDLILAIVIFLLTYIITTHIANSFSKRIDAIIKMADEIKNGNFDIKNNDTGRDEISTVAGAMEDMSKQLREMVKEINRRNEEGMLLKENDIHYREWLFDFVVEKNNDILAVVSEGGYNTDFITANAETVLGIPLEDLQEDIRLLAKAQRTDYEGVRLDDIFEDAFDVGDEVLIDEIAFENLKTGEHLYYRGVIVCTIDDGGKRMAVALYDRTQELRRNHQLQEALGAAETANKAKTSFLANMSHDFRTPMNAITGFNLLIEKYADDPDKVKEYTRKISLASHNLLSLLNDVLDMSKIESGKTTLDIQEMSIGLLLEEINSVISFQAKAKDQTYTVKADELTHDLFLGDKKRINEILVNILGNAIKYTPEGGKIVFSIIESASSSEGYQNLKFIVEDNGIGMKPEYKDKIFEAFSREETGATKTIQGTGLGMAITKSLVELMGGTIRVDSEEGNGSTFTVNLRLKLADISDGDIWKEHGINSFLGVNKSEKENEFFKEKMKASNLSGDVTTSGMEAIKKINEFVEQDKFVDFIIIDETIDDIAPLELVKEIRAKDKRHNSIIIVASENPEDCEDALKAAGCNAVLKKPVLEYSIKQALSELTSINTAAEEKNENQLEGMKFLAAEDNDINADILTELLGMFGATVTRGCNGQEVVDMFKAANEGDYDMILMDIQMPVMNGYEAAAAIRAIGSGWSQTIPIIAMTANAYADDVQQAFDAGMNAHVSKPIDIKVMEKTILEFKNRGQL